MLKRNKKSKLKFNRVELANKAVVQFEVLIRKIKDDYEDREKAAKNMLMVDTTVKYGKIIGLTDDENREMNGVLNPPESIDKSTRPEILKTRLKYIQDTLDKTLKGGDLKNIELQKRIDGLKTAKVLIERQIEKETVREQEEEDLSRLQRFKEWAKKNMVGLSVVAISIAGIITTIVVSARKAVLHGGQENGKFAKALYNLGQKIGSLIAPLLNIIAQVISLGAKGLAWLASNLWVLVVAFTLYLVGEYRKRRK